MPTTEPNDILLHKEHCVISIIWLLILHYEIGYTAANLDSAFMVLKRTLLTWINGVLTSQSVTNFNTDWKNGCMLSALINYCQPGLIDCTTLKASNSTENVRNALLVAKTKLGIESFMSAEEFTLEKPDEISVMMYVSQFCASGSCGQQVLLQWIQEQIPTENVTNFSSSWASGKALGALTNAMSGGKFSSYAELSPDNSLANIEQSMVAAEKLLGVRRTLTPANFVDTDELLRLSYLAQFNKAKENTESLMAVPAAADKVEISDIQIPNILGAGKAVWVELDCSDAGYGEVRAEVQGRKTGNVPVGVKEVEGADSMGTDKYRVSFEPTDVDVYNLSIFYGTDHVTGSPFSVNLYPPDPKKVEHTGTADNSETGQDVALNFETKEAGRGKLSAKAEGEVSGSVPVKINPLGDGTFAVSFNPQFPDVYTVDVFWGKFAAQAVGETTGPVALQVNQDKKSEYLVSFKPPNPDVYVVDVSWDGKPVPGSPFTVDLLPPPQPEEVECAVPIFNEPGEEAELLVDTSNAGSGQIKATCSGERVGLVPVELTKMVGRTYQCTFTPPEKDLYKLDVLFDDKHVKGSPFMIDMRPGAVVEVGEITDPPIIIATPDATKCIILNLPQSGIYIPVGRPLTFPVDCKDAGPGTIDVSIKGPGTPEVTITARSNEQSVFDVTFVPAEPSSYEISMTWEKQPIPNVPFSVSVYDPDTLISYPHGKPMSLDCDIEGKSGDIKAVAIHNNTGTNYKVKTAKVQKTKYKLSFSPKDHGIYRVHVTVKDKEIRESPFYVRYSKPAKPEATFVGGLGRKCYAGEPLKFTVVATDAGPGDLSVKALAPKQKKDKAVEIATTDNGDGVYTVNYTPQTIGDHSFSIAWAGKAIPGSPFVTNAVEHTPDIVTDVYLLENNGKPNESKKEIPASEDSIKTMIGNPLLLNITVSDDLADEPFVATATGKDGTPADLIITKPSSNVHSVLLNPTAGDTYTVEAKVGDKKVPRSPVIADYSAPISEPSKCRIVGIDETLPVYAKKPIDFKVLTDGAGPGDLAVTASAPLVAEPPIIEVKQSSLESVYNVSCTPNAPGDHKLNITWAGKDIPSSPVQFNVLEPPVYKLGQPVGMDINADCKPGDLEAHAVHVESNTPYKVKISKVTKGKYKLTLEPKDLGYYHVHVLMKQNEIKGSPFIVKYGQASKPEKCSIRDQPDFVYINRPINFTVDTNGAGSGELRIRASVPQTAEGVTRPDLKVKDNKDSTYSIEYTPNTTGKHAFDVLWSGESIPDSPVQVDVRSEGMDLTELLDDYISQRPPLPIDEKVEEAVPVNEVETVNPALLPEVPEAPIVVQRRQNPITIVVGKALKLKVRPKDDSQRNGTLTARAEGEVTGIATVKTTQNAEGIFEVYFNPPEPDYYVVEVKLNNDNVPQSPFHVLYIPAPIEEPAVEAPIEEFESVFIPEKPIDYFIDLSSVPSGTLSAKCVGEECGDVPVTYEPVAPDSKKYKVAFVPPQPDLYNLSVFFNDKELKTSPYKIDLRKKPIEELPIVEERMQPVENIPLLEDAPPFFTEELDKESSPSLDTLDAHTVEDVPTEEFTIFIGTPMVVKVHPKSEEQKKGVLSSTAIGDKVGSSFITAQKKSDDLFMVHFNPTEPDHYTVDVQINNSSVPRSPFRVNYIMPPIDASKCQIIGVKDIGSFVEVGSDVELRVDAAKAGPGNLSVLAERPSEEDGKEPTSMLSATPSQKDRGFYDVSYIPQSQGKHSLQFNWADQPIPMSPVDIFAVDPSRADVIPNGKPATFDIDADGSLKAHCIHKETNQNYKVKISKVHKGKYRVSFQPKDLGYYFLHTYVKDKELPQSPYVVRYARPAKPEAVKVIGLDTRAYTGETVDFTVDAREAGEGGLNIKTLGPDGKEIEGLTVTDKKDGTYLGEIVPKVAGMHELQMTWGGKPIPGQPFPLFVRDHSNEELLAWLFEIDRTKELRSVNFPEEGEVLTDTTDHTLMLRVKACTDEQKKEKLTATATNKATGKKTKLAVTKKGSDTFEALFVPKVPETYTIESQLGSTPIPHTPFTVKYGIPKADAGKCTILGLEKHPEKFQVNRPIAFQVDTRLAGEGKLSLTAEGVQVKPKLEARPNKDEPRIIDITYTPAAPGVHHIKVMWSGEPVPKSPLSFPVEAIPRFPYGKPIGYDLNIDAKHGDIDAHVIHENTKNKLKVKTTKVSKGKYRFGFSPKKPGLYALHILVKKKEISQSPIYFLYEGPPDASACVVKDFPENWYIHEPASFTVDATSAGTANLQVKMSAPVKGKEGETKITDNDDGTFTVEHTPETLGNHKFALTWGGKAIPDSPVKTVVKKRVPKAKTCLGPYTNVVPVGDKVQLDVVNLGRYAADTNYVTATARSKLSNDCPVVEDKDGMCSIDFVPTVADDYTLNVKIHNEDIEGSPFLIKAIEKPCLAQDFVPVQEVCSSDIEAGKEVCLVIPKDETVPSDFLPLVEAVGPEGPCDVQLIDQVESAYGLNFTPPIPGDYLVHVKKDKDADGEIDNSPFKLRAIEKESDAHKVVIPDDFHSLLVKPIPLGSEVNFDINTAAAGYGTLKIKQSGDGKGTINLTEKQNGIYCCKILATQRGRCQLKVLWNEEDIRGSPLYLTFVPVAGLNLEGEKFMVGTQNKFTVDRKSVVDGKLDIHCSDPQAATISIQSSDDDKEFYCVITVKKEGNYQIIVKYNGYDIVGSPYNVYFQKSTSVGLSFSLNAEGAEASDMSAIVQNSVTMENLPVNLTDLFGGKYALEFVPSEGIEYEVTIKCRLKVKTEEKVIANSPFSLRYESLPADASKCRAVGSGLTGAVAGVWSSFFVHTESAGTGELGVDIAGDMFGDEETIISAISPTKFEVRYILRKKGDYKISVTWNGQEISGSPFDIVCTAPASDKSFGEPIFPSEVSLGEPVEFTLTPVDPSIQKTDIQVQARSKSKIIGVIEGTVTPSDNGSFKCSIELSHSGKYLVEASYKSIPISGTPFIVNVSEPAKPEKVKAFGPGLSDGIVGQEGNFTVDTQDAGSGTITVDVEGPESGFQVSLNYHPDNNRIIIGSYNPQRAGLYTVSIKWAGVEIPNSPFQVNIGQW